MWIMMWVLVRLHDTIIVLQKVKWQAGNNIMLVNSEFVSQGIKINQDKKVTKENIH